MMVDLLLPQPLPMIDLNDSNDCLINDDQFDPLPLDAHHGSDLIIGLSDLRLMQDVLSSPRNQRQLQLQLHNPPPSIVKRTRRVSFQEAPTEIAVPSFACLGERERRGLWYHTSEIDYFRSTARHACRELRKNSNAVPEEIPRGLELRTSLDRQYRKHLALSCILKAQVRFPKMDPVDLAALADRCTALPRQEALVQGTRDFCDVYLPPDFLNPHQPSQPQQQQQSSMNSIIVCDNKRNWTLEGEEEQVLPRMKRQRFLPLDEGEQPLTFPPLCSLMEQDILL